MNWSVTTVEQSRHLLELGIPEESANLFYYKDFLNKGGNYELGILKHTYHKSLFKDLEDNTLPAWNVDSLISLLPDKINVLDAPKDHDAELVMDKHTVTYFDWTGMQHGPSFTSKDNLLNALYDMICWLLENNYILNFAG